MSMFNTEHIPVATDTEFDRHLQIDAKLQEHYLNLLSALYQEWTEEELARAAFHFVYDTADHEARIEHLIITWRCRRALKHDDPYHIELARAADMWLREQQLRKGQGQGR